MERTQKTMKKWMSGLLAVAVILGMPNGTMIMGDSSSVYAAGTTSLKQLQKDLTHALNQRLSSLQVTYSGSTSTLKKDMNELLDAALSSEDYLHYTVKTYRYNATTKGNISKITFRFTYWETLAQTNEVKKRVKQIVNKIVTTSMNDHQKVKAIHDWIVSNIAYDNRLVSHSAYDGLIKGKTVCQGYALITYEMLKQAGIPVKIVEGTSRGIAHAWNLVQIGGNWYHVDTTWDDPVPDVAGQVRYNYYNLTDAQLRKDHKWKASTSYPLAVTPYDQTLTALTAKDSSRASFYKSLYKEMGYIYLTDANTATSLLDLTNKISAAVDKRQQELVIRYMKGTTVTSDMKKAFNAQEGLSGFSYSQEDFTRTPDNDKLLRIVFKYSP
jgi:hypothetical protein